MNGVKFPLNPDKRSARRTLCEVLREIWRDAEARGDAVTMSRANEAHDMAKRMNERLKEYAEGRA